MSKRGGIAVGLSSGAMLLSGLAFGVHSSRQHPENDLSTLNAPSSPLSSDLDTLVFEYPIEPGDTFWKVAVRFLGDGYRFEELIQLNPDLDHTDLQPGQKIIVPYESENFNRRSNQQTLEENSAIIRTPINELQISALGIEHIIEFEGFSAKAYQCTAGQWTIGYGHTRTAKKGLVISSDKAEELLKIDLNQHIGELKDLVKVPLTQNEFDALASLIFNIGSDQFGDSTLLKVLNQGEYDQVPAQIKRWNKVDGRVVRGLERRRESEAQLFGSSSPYR